MFKRMNHLPNFVSFGFRKIIFFTLRVCRNQKYFLINFKIDINDAETSTLAALLKCEPHFADAAGAFHDGTNFRVGKQFLLQSAQIVVV